MFEGIPVTVLVREYNAALQDLEAHRASVETLEHLLANAIPANSGPVEAQLVFARIAYAKVWHDTLEADLLRKEAELKVAPTAPEGKVESLVRFRVLKAIKDNGPVPRHVLQTGLGIPVPRETVFNEIRRAVERGEVRWTLDLHLEVGPNFPDPLPTPPCLQ